MKMRKFFLIIAVIVLFVPSIVFAKQLHVTTIARDPFVRISNNGTFSGFSVDLWNAIVKDREWDYVFEPVDSFVELLRAPRKGTSDLAIANISITADREEVMDFSSSIFDSGLQIIVTKQNTFSQFFEALFSKQIFYILLTIGLIFLVFVNVIWFFERSGIDEKNNKKYLFGILHIAWQTWTWGEFGKNFPKTFIARATLIIWMILQMVALSFFTASLTSVMIVQNMTKQVSSYKDLHNKKVGTTRGSTSEIFLRKHDIDTILYDNVNALFNDVADGKIDAAVHDAPLVQYFSTHKGAGKVVLIPNIFNKEKYGIALPTNSPLKTEIDTALLRLRENGTYQKIYNKWFGIDN